MSPPVAVRDAFGRLRAWLTDEALPLWWSRSADTAQGGFIDRLELDGLPATGFAKRVRVQARQAFVFGLADSRGWMRGADRACHHALAGLASMRRADGLYRPTVPGQGPLDGMGLLYDQAFALLALDTGRAVFADPRFERDGDALREKLAEFAHPLGGFCEAPELARPLFANPNMHLFESFQAWHEVAMADPVWTELAAGQAHLALEQLIDPASGALYERYDADWRAPPASERVVWPGHLYEWGFLLLRWGGGPQAEAAALRLIDVAETHGVDAQRRIAIFALDGALAPLDRGGRLWSQTERLRAVAAAAALKDDANLWSAAEDACQAVEAFLDVSMPGLWRDWMDEAGAFREEPAPASTFYHIVSAIAELERLVDG